MITVMGATGHTGQAIARALLGAGEAVRALGRSADRLAPLAAAGAEALVGDAGDAEFLTRAFRGADAVYALLPPDQGAADYHAAQRQKGEAMVQALRESGAKRVVFLSSLGAEAGEGRGLVAGLHAQEERLKRLEGVDLLFVRPASFFENFYGALELVKNQGFYADSVAPNLAIPMVAARDVAAAAAQALRARDWRKVAVRELLGPRDLSYAEATRLFGERIGKPDLPYVPLSYGDMAGALAQAGVSATFAGLYVEMTRAINEGRLAPREGRRPENTTPTRFEDFADELARAYAAAA